MMSLYPRIVILFVAVTTCGASAETVVVNGAQLKFVDDVHVASGEAGIVESILVKPNDAVERGRPLVRLSDARYRMEVDGAQKNLAIALEKSQNNVHVRYAAKAAEVARKELDRARAAAAQYSRAVSQSQLEQSELELDQAILSGDQALHEQTVNGLTADLRESELRLKQLDAQRRTVLSPLLGQAAEVLVQEGEWVDPGTPVVRVVNLRKLRIIALVSADLVLDVAQGLPAHWKLQLGDKTLQASGVVSYVSPEVNPVNHEFVIWVDIDNGNGQLRPGLVGTLQIELPERVDHTGQDGVSGA